MPFAAASSAVRLASSGRWPSSSTVIVRLRSVRWICIGPLPGTIVATWPRVTTVEVVAFSGEPAIGTDSAFVRLARSSLLPIRVMSICGCPARRSTLAVLPGLGHVPQEEDPVASLAAGRIGQADDTEGGQTTADVHLDGDGDAVDPSQDGRTDTGKHCRSTNSWFDRGAGRLPRFGIPANMIAEPTPSP